ncbi:MAG: hypothetical protein IPJ03_17445 [Ignavibacteriales bacterium]|nr:hypothetical protein [Ignavibacteriales bacterium]
MKLIFFLIFSCFTFAQEVRFEKDADTTNIRNKGLTTPAEIIAGRKNVDSLFLNSTRFKDNVSMDSTLILKKGFKDYNTDTVIDSFKTSDNMDYLNIYLTTADDTLRFFSATGDSLEYWHKDLLYKSPKNLPLITISGNVKYARLPHQGNEYYVDFDNGTNNPDSFQTSGVKDLWYASYLVNADSNGTNLIEHGQIEDSLLTAAAWTFGGDYQWSMSTSVMSGYYHPNSTKSINLTSNNALSTKPFSITQYVHLDSGKSYTWEYLLKQTGVLALSKVSIRDSASNFTYYEDILDHTTPFDWTKFGGGLADTISTTFEIIAYREDRHLDWGEVVNHWTDAGNHTLSAEDEIFYKADWSGKVVSTGAGDSTTNYVSLATGFSELRADTTYTLTGYFTKDEDVVAAGDSVTMKFGEFDTTFALTGLWVDRVMTFTASAYTFANAEIRIWANRATTFYIDHFSLEYNGGDRTAKVVVQGNAIQDQGNLYLDNFIIQELVDTSLGWLQGGDAIILSGDFAEDSLNLSGKYVKGESYLPISITSKGSARILGNWAVDNGIKLDNHIYGIAVSDIYIEKCNRSGLVMTSEDGGLIYGRLSRLNIDSTGRWDRTLGIATPPAGIGAYMGVDIRGQYTWSTNLKITNTGNDILSIYGTHHWIRNVYGTGGYNAGNGDGFQLKASGYMTVTDNEIYSLRYLKLLAGETIPDTLDGGVYDNKSGILINQQGGEGADYNEVSYNKIYGFSNSLAGNVRYSNIHHNYLVNPKYNILSGSIGGGTGISMIGWGCNVYDNVSIGAPIGIQLGKDYADSLNVSNNSIINFSTFGIQVKKASDTNDKIEWYNNLLYTDSLGTEIVDVHNSYVPTIWNYNLYYSPENTFDFHDSTTFAGVQNLGYEANGLNSNPLLEYGFRLRYNSPAKDAGTTGLTLTDYFDNGVKTSSANLITNGTFDDSTDWVFVFGGDHTISGGWLNIGNLEGTYISHAYPFVEGKRYLVSLDVVEGGTRAVYFYLYDIDGVISPQVGQFDTGVGHKEFIISVVNNSILGFSLGQDEIINASIDNLTIQELKRDIGAVESQ